VPNFISVLLTPVFGLSVDWFGHRTTLLFCAAVFLVVAHVMIYVGVLASPVFPLVMIGLAFRLVFIVWCGLLFCCVVWIIVVAPHVFS